MYEIQEYRPGDEKAAVALLVIVVLMVAAGSFGYMLGIRNAGTGVHDNGNGISHIGEQLGQAVSHQQQITDGIKDAESTVSGIAETGSAIAESAHSIEAGVGEAASLIDSSQQILGRIRNRGQKGTVAH